MFDDFMKVWNCEELEVSAGTNRLAYRIIGSYKFQFRKVDYKARTALLIEAASILTNISELYEGIASIDAEATDEAATGYLLPLVVKAITNPRLQPVIDNLCATVAVDLGQGTFQALSDINIGEQVFGSDITLQLPVALTAAQVNFDSIFKHLPSLG